MKQFIFFICTLLPIGLLAGCIFKTDSPPESEVNKNVFKQTKEAEVVIADEKLSITERVGTEDNYKHLHDITDREKIKQAEDILQNFEPENKIVDHIYPPDYKINDQYFIWVTPQDNILEVVDPDIGYIKLSKEDSKILYEIIIDEKLNE